MKLELLFDQLLSRVLLSGQDQRGELRDGLRLALGLRNDQLVLTIARSNAITPREEANVCAICDVPASAVRVPLQGVKRRSVEGIEWRFVVFRWAIPPEIASYAQARISTTGDQRAPRSG